MQLGNKIYTRNGDGGKTSLLDGKEIPKTDVRIELLGKLDYLNCLLGHAKVIDDDLYYLELQGSFYDILEKLQENIFEISGYVASLNTGKFFDYKILNIDEMEETIDRIYSRKTQECFVYPGCGELNSRIHLSRAYCREVERFILKVDSIHFRIDKTIKIFTNRMSDFLYALAHFAAIIENKKENKWKGRKND